MNYLILLSKKSIISVLLVSVILLGCEAQNMAVQKSLTEYFIQGGSTKNQTETFIQGGPSRNSQTEVFTQSDNRRSQTEKFTQRDNRRDQTEFFLQSDNRINQTETFTQGSSGRIQTEFSVQSDNRINQTETFTQGSSGRIQTEFSVQSDNRKSQTETFTQGSSSRIQTETSVQSDNRKEQTETFTQGSSSKSQTEIFAQNTPSKQLIDILWVMDNSGSMRSEQEALGNNFSSFIDHFLSKNIDFKMGIITTDNIVNKDDQNKLNLAYAKKDGVDFKSYFKQKIAVGTRGSANERGLSMSLNFLNANTSWSRENAYLVIIYISDEEDHSTGTSSYFVNEIKKHKTNTDLIKLCTITNEWGDRYKEVAKATEGFVADIDESFNTVLDDFGELISDLSKSFQLSSNPEVDSINVYVEDVLSSADDWSYSSDENNIQFHEDSIPDPNQKIKVVYTIFGSDNQEESFKLKNKADENTIKVYIDSVISPVDQWSYDSLSNTVEFYPEYIPAPNQEIKITYKKWSNIKRKDSYTLKEKADDSTIKVHVGGVSSPTDQWSYDSLKNTITFYDGYIPNFNQEVKITYTVFNSNKQKSSFTIKDTAAVDTIKVYVNNTLSLSSKWSYTPQTKIIKFSSQNIPSPNQVIKITYKVSGSTKKKSSFTIKEAAIEESIKVYVDGTLSSSNKWSYNPQSKAITFNQQNIPEYEQKIKIIYTVLNSITQKDFFTLRDTAAADTIKVYVDNTLSSSNKWSYTPQTKIIKFSSQNIPNPNQVIKITYKVSGSANKKNSFTIKEAAIEESIKVYVDGILSSSNKWSYNSQSKAITFNQQNIPEYDQKIRIIYTVLNSIKQKDSFTLRDTAAADTIKVYVDNTLSSSNKWSYTPKYKDHKILFTKYSQS